jgi:hypothetical protein
MKPSKTTKVPTRGDTKTGTELHPQNLTPVKVDVKFYNPNLDNCSLNTCIDKFNKVIRVKTKNTKGTFYYTYYNVCSECERKYMSSRNKTDTSESKRRSDLGYNEMEDTDNE